MKFERMTGQQIIDTYEKPLNLDEKKLLRYGVIDYGVLVPDRVYSCEKSGDYWDLETDVETELIEFIEQSAREGNLGGIMTYIQLDGDVILSVWLPEQTTNGN